MNRVLLCTLFVVSTMSHASLAMAGSVPIIGGVASQPLGAQVVRISEALRFLGQPLTAERQQALDAALQESDEKQMVIAIQEALDPLVLAFVTINPESRVKASARTLGRTRASKSGEKRYTFAELRRNMMNVSEPLIK